jgi:hypothetical protein
VRHTRLAGGRLSAQRRRHRDRGGAGRERAGRAPRRRALRPAIIQSALPRHPTSAPHAAPARVSAACVYRVF